MGMHAHVAWLRQQGMLESVMDAPARKSDTSSRLASHRLAKSEKSPAAAQPGTPKPVAVATPKSPAPIRAASSPKQLLPVPAEIAAKGPIHVQAYRETCSEIRGQLARINSMDAVKGRYGSAIMLCTEGLTDAELLSRLATAPTDRQRAADAVWTRAYAKIAEERGINASAAKMLVAQQRVSPPNEKAQKILANQRAFGGGKGSAADERADSVWDRAWASNSKGTAR